MNFIKKVLILLVALHSLQAAASPVNVTGTINVKVNQNKHIKILRLKLSDKAKENWRKRLHKSTFSLRRTPNAHYISLPSKVNLGMNNTPVLDQGSNGTCVAFANTAAIDAELSLGDYISQLCYLNLSEYLHRKNADNKSAWHGLRGINVWRQIKKYGIVSKQYQRQYGCGGLKTYPELVFDEPQMTAGDYISVSEGVASKIQYRQLLTEEKAWSKNHDPQEVLYQVKKALSVGGRVTFGLVVYYVDDTVYRAGSYHSHADTFVLTPNIIKGYDDYTGDIGGHEMIIYGYDDNATVTSEEDGQVSHGLLFIRNSWGENTGDHGDFYMTYDYFKKMTLEAQVIDKRHIGPL